MDFHSFEITGKRSGIVIVDLMVKTGLAVMLAAGVCFGLFTQDEWEVNVTYTEVDTFGTYKGIPVVAQVALAYSSDARGQGDTEERVRITLINTPPDFDEGGGDRKLLTFTYVYPDETEVPRLFYKVSKDRLQVFQRGGMGKPLLEFDIQVGFLELSDEWIQNIERCYDRGLDSAIPYFDLITILESSDCDRWYALRILNMMRLRGEYRSGVVDRVIPELEKIKSEALENSEDFVVSRCRKLLAEINRHHQAFQPLILNKARKIGRVLGAPVFPPVDSPTIFWKDSLLSVVQENDTMSSTKMRLYDPRTKKWGKVVDLHYPESGYKGFYEMESSGCRTYNNYWHAKLTGAQPYHCYGLPRRPLVVVPGPVLLYPQIFFADGGDLANFSNNQVPDYSEMDWKYLHGLLKKAGGSCIAGKGRNTFTEYGRVSIRGDTCETWTVLPEVLVRSPRSEEYPVVVSPDQMWICYAVHAADNAHKIELWVARIDYRYTK